VFDAVYNPRETRLLAAARRLGKRAVEGMPMLVWQACEAHTIWYSASFDPVEIRRLIGDSQAEMERMFGV
jgi:shikimate 5-dehydrogenase